MHFGERLKCAREHANLTQQELEAVAGVSQKTISKIERMEQEGSTAVVQLALACGVRPEWLAMEAGAMTAPEEASAALSKPARHLIRRLEQAERAGTSSPLLLAALEKVMDLGLPRKTAAPLAAETADFAGKPRRFAQADPAIDGATPRRKR